MMIRRDIGDVCEDFQCGTLVEGGQTQRRLLADICLPHLSANALKGREPVSNVGWDEPCWAEIVAACASIDTY